MITSLIFYLFAAITVSASFMVVISRNPVHSVLFLILTFFNAAGLFILMGAEFLAMMLVVVYVGAVAVLFLFVVMMLNINFVKLREGFIKYLPVGSLIGLILLVEIVFIASTWVFSDSVSDNFKNVAPDINILSNTHALGAILYTDYAALFQIAGLILLIAMVGAIVLTLRVRPGVRKQNVMKQHERKVSDSLEVVKNLQKGGGV